MNQALGILETTGLTPALVGLDGMEKSASVDVVQAELNDFYGYVLKIRGSIADVETALRRGAELATQLGGNPVTTVIRHPDPRANAALFSSPEFNPLIMQDVVHIPAQRPQNFESATPQGSMSMNDSPPQALGFIETQGFTAVFQAIDTACKSANVEVVGKEKLGGGYVTVIIRGDVAAVTAAVEAGTAAVEGLGKLIAAHVISRPSASVLALLPK